MRYQSLLVCTLLCQAPASTFAQDSDLQACTNSTCAEAISPRGHGNLGSAARRLQAKGAAVSRPTTRPTDQSESNDIGADRAKESGQVETTTPEKQPNVGGEDAASLCIAKLQKIATAKLVSHPEKTDNECTILQPVELVSTVAPNPVSFSKGLILDCNYAVTIAEFVARIAQPLAKYHTGSTLTRIHSGQGYVCRRRNNAADGKLSEHAFGNAMDLVSFEFYDGRRLPVRSSGRMSGEEATFFDALRKAACGSFTTVLGPGSNPAHATHLHLDLGRAKDKKNPYRICE